MDEVTPVMIQGLAHYANEGRSSQLVNLLYARPGSA